VCEGVPAVVCGGGVPRGGAASVAPGRTATFRSVRLLIITWRLFPIAISFRRDWARWVVGGAPIDRSPEFHRSRAQRIAASLAALGPTFVKFAQLIGARADLVPEPYLGALASLMDRVPPAPWPRIARQLTRSYGRPIDQVFESIEQTPLASASLGQVYDGRVGGRRVAIKVLRPGVERLVAADLSASRRLLRALTWLFGNRPRVRRILGQLATVIEEFGFRIDDELDYRKEAANAIEIRENFAGSDGIIVPEVLGALVRRQVLVLEFVEGTPLDALDARVAARQLDIAALVSHLVEAYVAMMMVDGLFHADPHPRNLLVAPDGSLVLLDFGMVVRVSRAMRRTLLATILAAIRRDVDGVVAGFDELGLIAPGATRADVRPLIALLLAMASGYTTVEERVELLADQVMVNLYDSPLTLPSSMVYFARTAALIEGMALRYDPRFNPLAVATPVLLRMHPTIAAALDRTHTPSLGALAVGLTGVIGQGLDTVATRLGVGQRGEVARWADRLVSRARRYLDHGSLSSNGSGARPGR